MAVARATTRARATIRPSPDTGSPDRSVPLLARQPGGLVVSVDGSWRTTPSRIGIIPRPTERIRGEAPLAQLIEEVRVVSAAEVRVTYRVPPTVRLPDGMVEMRGLEPLTPAMRTRCSPS